MICSDWRQKYQNLVCSEILNPSSRSGKVGFCRSSFPHCQGKMINYDFQESLCTSASDCLGLPHWYCISQSAAFSASICLKVVVFLKTSIVKKKLPDFQHGETKIAWLLLEKQSMTEIVLQIVGPNFHRHLEKLRGRIWAVTCLCKLCSWLMELRDASIALLPKILRPFALLPDFRAQQIDPTQFYPGEVLWWFAPISMTCISVIFGSWSSNPFHRDDFLTASIIVPTSSCSLELA